MKELFSNVYNKSLSDLKMDLKKYLKNDKKEFIITANAEIFMLAKDNDELYAMLNNKDNIIVPDGIGIVKAMKKYKYDVTERVTGVDIASSLFEIGNECKKSIFLFGAKEEVVNKLKDKLAVDYPNLKICGYCDGYVEDKDKKFDEIAELDPDIILVAMGVPKQEILINKNLSKFKKGIFVGVGGSFDVLSGLKKRAPEFFIKHNLEWFYRITTEPKRLKRFYKYNIKLLFELRKDK